MKIIRVVHFGGTLALFLPSIADALRGACACMQELVDGNLTTICPVNRMHPRRDLIISGSSRCACTVHISVLWLHKATNSTDQQQRY